MNNLQEQHKKNQNKEEAATSELQDLVRAIIKGYQDAFNRANDKNEIQFTLTITNHKVATPEGNKDCAYLRLDRYIRPKTEEGKEAAEWSIRLLHNEAYFFRSMQERLDHTAPWRDQLYVNLLSRLISAGLEYAELLQRIKQTEINMDKPKSKNETEERLNNMGLVGAKEAPVPLTKSDENYKEWLEKERSKEGL